MHFTSLDNSAVSTEELHFTLEEALNIKMSPSTPAMLQPQHLWKLPV